MSSLLYVLLQLVFTDCQDNCLAAELATNILYAIGFSSSSFLFFLRIRAIFSRNNRIQSLFFLLWLGVVGGASVPLIKTSTYFDPTGDHYASEKLKYICPSTIAVNDTLVFIAISWQLIMNSYEDPKKKWGMKNIVLGSYLLRFQRGLFRDGQIYYL